MHITHDLRIQVSICLNALFVNINIHVQATIHLGYINKPMAMRYHFRKQMSQEVKHPPKKNQPDCMKTD